MKKLLQFVLVLLVLASFVIISCDDEDDDDNGTNPTRYQLMDGTWSFALTPQDTSDGESTVMEEVYLYEYEDAVVGYSGLFSLQGSRDGNEVSLDVMRFMEDLSEVESKMTLTLTDDDTLVGAGTHTQPKIHPILQSDSTLHEKFQRTHEDWDGGEGGTFFYDVDAVRVGDAPSEAVVQQKMTHYQVTDINWCDVIWSIDSFLISTLTDGWVRPFGNCGFQRDGGGYYLAGRTGPGSMIPLMTETVYFPYEWVWCGSRSYGFTMTIEEAVPLSTLETILNYTGSTDFFGWTIQQLYNQIVDFDNQHGGFAICSGYSTATHNTSIYFMSEANISFDTFVAHPLGSAVYDGINAARPGGLWIFSGSTVHDSWSLDRDGSGLCSSPLLFVYIVGTNNVNFN